MADEPVNPYAPPAEEASAAEIPGMWRVEADCLVVREGMILPPVDLHGHGIRGALTPMMLRLPVPLDGKGLLVNAGIGVFVIAYLLYESMTGGKVSFVGIMVALVVGQFVFRGVKIRTAPAHVFGFIAVPAARAMTRRARWRTRLLLLSLLPIFTLLGLVSLVSAGGRRTGWMLDSVEMALGSLVASLVMVVAVVIWGALDRGWRCARARDGWVWVKGLGPDALARLSALSHEPPPAPVKRQTFRARLDRMPASFWYQTLGGGLAGWWGMLRMKLRRGPLEQWMFHWSERRWLPPEQADPELMEAWSRETDGSALASWNPVYAELARSPDGCTQVNEVAFLSPDGRHLAIPAISRTVIGRKLTEVRETNFRSFTRSGRILATGSLEVPGPLPGEFEFLRSKGPPTRIAEVHLRRAKAEDLMPVNAEGATEQERREMQLFHDVRVAAGIYGPLEEMDVNYQWE